MQLRLRFEEDWQMRPMHQIAAHRMPPVHIVPAKTIRIELVEQMVASLEMTQAVRIIHPASEWLEMRRRASETIIDLLQRRLRIPFIVVRIHADETHAFIKEILTLGQVGEPHSQSVRTHRNTHVHRHRNQEMVATLGHRHGMAGDLMAVPVCNGDGSVIAASFGEQFQQTVAAGFDDNGIVVRHNNLLHSAT